MTVPDHFVLNTGASIPSVAFGTYQSDPQGTYKAVLHALQHGYKHIDAARYYKNEDEVGQALKDSGVARSDIFLTTKVWNTEHRDVAKALDDSLKTLGVEYVDLLLLHWPVSRVPTPGASELDDGVANDTIELHEVWQQFQNLPKSKVKAIGVSNFTSRRLKALLDHPSTTVVPACNQCEFHPLLPQKKLVDFCLANNIRPEAYCPLARGKLDHPTITAVAKAHNCDPGQVALSWNVARGVVVLPKSFTPSRIDTNRKLIQLSEEEIEAVSAIGKEHYERLVHPDESSIGDFDVFEDDVDCK